MQNGGDFWRKLVRKASKISFYTVAAVFAGLVAVNSFLKNDYQTAGIAAFIAVLLFVAGTSE